MADDSEQIGQDEVESLLRQSQGGPQAPESEGATRAKNPGDGPIEQAALDAQSSVNDPSSPAASADASASSGDVSPSDIDLLLEKAEQALESIDQPTSADALPAGVKSFEFEPFVGTAANREAATLELMRDVQLDMTIELGRTHMHLEDVLKLKQGSVVPLDKLAGDPADIFVNGRLIARGEVLVLNDNFCIRVAELIVGESACA